jgi:hypothetical protein
VQLLFLDSVVVTNRQTAALYHRIQCYQLELVNPVGVVTFSYPLVGNLSSYTFRDASVASTCYLSPPPPPMAPLPSTPACAAVAGQMVHFVRISWRGGGSLCSDGFLHVAEVQVFYNGYNIALGKPASALDGFRLHFSPDQATNGITTSVYHSASANSSAFLAVNLEVRRLRRAAAGPGRRPMSGGRIAAGAASPAAPCGCGIARACVTCRRRRHRWPHPLASPAPSPPQNNYDFGYISKVVVLNRQDCCQERIQCYKLELQNELNQTLYSYDFTALAASYTIRDTSTAGVQATCNAPPPSPPPAPPSPPMPPAPVKCQTDTGVFMRYVRIAWTDSSVSAATCSGGTSGALGGHLNVAELQVWYNGYNLALGKPATALDTYGDNVASYGPSKLTDGSTGTMYHSKSENSNTYVEVDLQVRRWRGRRWIVTAVSQLQLERQPPIAANAGELRPGVRGQASGVQPAGLLPDAHQMLLATASGRCRQQVGRFTFRRRHGGHHAEIS